LRCKYLWNFKLEDVVGKHSFKSPLLEAKGITEKTVSQLYWRRWDFANVD
jgi:hypothetical protein